MTHLKISKIIIIFFSFFLLLFLHPFKAAASIQTYTLSGNDTQTIYLPGPVKVGKVNIYACSVQNRNGGFQLGIRLLYNNIQVAYKDTLNYARSDCPMWSFGGSAEGTAFDFGGTSADAIQIIPILGSGSYYQMFVSYEEGAEPPPSIIQCGVNNTIGEYVDFYVSWGGWGDFSLPAAEKIHLVNLYGCCDQNRDGGCSDSITLLYNGTQVAYIGIPWGGPGNVLAFGRSGCPMWSYALSSTAGALNFGGVLTNTIRAVGIGRIGAAINRIFYTHEPVECSLSHKTCQNNSCITVTGAGADQCSSDASCALPIPNTEYLIEPPFASKQDGQTQQFIGWYDPDGQGGLQPQEDKTTSATWTSSNTSIATINSSGLATCVSAGGPITITSIYSGITTIASLTCTPVCGDGTCNGTETCSTCAADCPCPVGNITIEAKGPTGSFTPGLITIDKGQSADIRWETSDIVPNSCSASNTSGLPWAGAKPDQNWPNGETSGAVQKTTTFTLTCTDANGPFSNSVDVKVTFRPLWKEIFPW